MSSSSGSSVIPPKVKYDVFLSFRGSDTRQTFTSHLHAALIRSKVDTYMDYRLERGDEVGPALLKAIRSSKISVVIFSKDYASSGWCLDELAYIIKCKETYGQCVIPIFYEIDPSDVRYQKENYKTAFDKHEQRSNDKVAKWKKAILEAAADLSGFHSAARTARDDAALVEQVVKDVLVKLNRKSTPFDFTGLIGVESRMKEILLELEIIPEDVRVRSVVIWGMGGIGKTTLADAVFHGLSSQFEAHCYLPNVRERSGPEGANPSPQLFSLRDQLLRKLLGDEKLTIDTPTIENFVGERLSRTKALVVLDDVNHSSQLEFLVGKVPFGPGSRIIITTRDRQPVKKNTLRANHDVKIYEAKGLNIDESLQLLHLKSPTHCPTDQECLWKVANYAAGVPLALNILSSSFFECQSKEEEERLWAELRKFPDDDLQKVYRVSYDGLKKSEREIFLDIACFHKGNELDDAKRILTACGLFPDRGINILIDKSLISIIDNCIWMHDLIQEMGWEIVREEDPDEPGRRSRLHDGDDVCHVLTRNKGTEKVKSISDWGSGIRQILEIALDPQAFWGSGIRQTLEITLDPQAFTGMYNLRYLMLSYVQHDDNMKNLEYLPAALGYLNWDYYPLESMPSKFSPDKLVELHMPYSKLKRLWNNGENPKNLRRIDLHNSWELVEIGGLSNCVNIESINLQGCRSLVQVPDLPESVNLTSLNLSGTNIEIVPSSLFMCMTDITSVDFSDCQRLVSLPTDICKLKSLERLDLCGCSSFTNFPEIEEPMEHLQYLNLSKTKIEELPSSIGNLVGLKELVITDCTSLEVLPNSFHKFNVLERLTLFGCVKLKEFPPSFILCSLIHLDLRGCELLQEIPDCFTSFPALQHLNLSGTMIETIALSNKQVCRLESLVVPGCMQLQSLPVGNLDGLKELVITDHTSLELPNSFQKLKVLERLTLVGCVKLKEFPPSFIFCSLIHLDLRGCELLQEIPDCFTSFPALQHLNLSGTMIETIPPSIKQVSRLESLFISGCMQLQSLPVLPCLLSDLEAERCSKLKTVLTSSVTTEAQGLDQILSIGEERYEFLTFESCTNLDEVSRSNIMDDAHLRIMRMAAVHASKRIPYGDVAVVCSGINEIPKWFTHQTEGSSMSIKLPLHWSDASNFFGIALCSVASNHSGDLRYGCTMILKTNNGETHTFHWRTRQGFKNVTEHHLMVWYDTNSPGILDKAKLYTEATFDFYTLSWKGPISNVRRCGVCFLKVPSQDEMPLSKPMGIPEHAINEEEKVLKRE